MMTLTSATNAPKKVVRFAEPVRDNEHLFISKFDEPLLDVYAREEDANRDSLNKKTFDPVNDIETCFGNFRFTHRHFTLIPERPDRSVYYFIHLDDDVCSCGYHVSSQLSNDEKRMAGSRIYIPRLRVNDSSFNHNNSIQNEITNQLGNFCNIVHIDLKWLQNVGDFSAFVHLNIYEPFKQNHAGQVTMCNLSCPKCKSLTLNINKHIFWMLLPSWDM